MPTLKDQVVQKVSGLSEENMQFILDMIDCFMQSDSEEKNSVAVPKRIGIAKGQHLYDDDYDFDEMNSGIGLMFRGME